MTNTTARRCGAELHHTHGTAVCDLPEGHDGEHGALCGICYEHGYDDPSDRLEWEHDGEDWLIRKHPAPDVIAARAIDQES